MNADLNLGVFNPGVISKNKISILIKNFHATGSSHHSKSRLLIGYLIDECEKHNIPYRLTCYPNLGYSIEKVVASV